MPVLASKEIRVSRVIAVRPDRQGRSSVVEVKLLPSGVPKEKRVSRAKESSDRREAKEIAVDAANLGVPALKVS